MKSATILWPVMLMNTLGGMGLERAPIPPVTAHLEEYNQATGTTYYIRVDGGNLQECTGLTDTPYPGSGMHRTCAWDHPFRAVPPGGTPRLAGGDTLVIRNGAYRMGYGAPSAGKCYANDAFDCLMPPIPSEGNTGHPTCILNDVKHDLCPGLHDICGLAPGLTNTSIDLFNADLLAGSPAIDAASSSSCPATDLHGVPRPQGSGCDLGALEYAPRLTFRSIGDYDGWILESSENSNWGGILDKPATTFHLGNSAQDKQYRAILSFDTSKLPETAVITKVTLLIKKQELLGTNPFALLGGLKVDMCKPYFGP